jgi:acrylyl-CoA reductase (NADPH)
MAPIAARRDAWARLATDLDAAKLAAITEVVPLDQAIAKAQDLMQGKVRGRIVVKI